MVKKEIKHYVTKVKAKLKSAELKVHSAIKKNPEKAALIAAGVGAALGAAITAAIAVAIAKKKK